MDVAMMDDLKELLRDGPFVSFRIVLTSGNTYDVTTPFQLARGQSQGHDYHPRSDRKALLRLNQIASYEALEQTPSSWDVRIEK